MAKPTITRRSGTRPAMTVATIAVKSGTTAFNIPVNAEETLCSANGNMLRGKANHKTPTRAMPGHADRAMRLRAAGNKARVIHPIDKRTKVTPLGPIAFNPSAIKRKDAPQMSPGIAISSHSADTTNRTQLDLYLSSFMLPRCHRSKDYAPHVPCQKVISSLDLVRCSAQQNVEKTPPCLSNSECRCHRRQKMAHEFAPGLRL